MQHAARKGKQRGGDAKCRYQSNPAPNKHAAALGRCFELFLRRNEIVRQRRKPFVSVQHPTGTIDVGLLHLQSEFGDERAVTETIPINVDAAPEPTVNTKLRPVAANRIRGCNSIGSRSRSYRMTIWEGAVTTISGFPL
jgi:hypothetical protein